METTYHPHQHPKTPAHISSDRDMGGGPWVLWSRLLVIINNIGLLLWWLVPAHVECCEHHGGKKKLPVPITFLIHLFIDNFLSTCRDTTDGYWEVWLQCSRGRPSLEVSLDSFVIGKSQAYAILWKKQMLGQEPRKQEACGDPRALFKSALHGSFQVTLQFGEACSQL